jgi:membrane protease YdiL (CAAX protease family)
MCTGFIEWQSLFPAFFNLAIAGWALALARERTGSLWFSIGLHAGWIFWVKSFAFLTVALPTSNAWVWGSSRLIDGWVAMAILAITIPAVARLATQQAAGQKPAEIT